MSLLWTNHVTDPFISIQNLTRKPAPRLSHKSPLKGYMVTCYWHLSQHVLENPIFFFFAGNVVYKTILIFFYQNLLLKVKVDWKNSKTSQDVLGLTAGVCLKASKKSQKDFK